MQALPTLFRYTHSPTLPKLLWQLGCTLAFSTYQAGKVIFIRATSPEKIEQHALDFPRPMGLAVSDQRIAVATREEVVVLANTSVEESPESHYVDSGAGAVRNSAYQTGDAAADTYVREKTYFSGEVDTHDLAWGKDGLWAINTLLSSMALVDDDSGLESKWRPPFVSDVTPEDRCHLNSMAMVDGQPEYVTAFGEVDTFEGVAREQSIGRDCNGYSQWRDCIGRVTYAALPTRLRWETLSVAFGYRRVSVCRTRNGWVRSGCTDARLRTRDGAVW